MKPNSSHSLAQLKDYVRKNKLNKGLVPLSLNKSEMIKRLKQHDHWDNTSTEKKKTSVKDRVKTIEKKVDDSSSSVNKLLSDPDENDEGLNLESIRSGLRRWSKSSKVKIRGINSATYDSLMTTIKTLRNKGSSQGTKLTNEDILKFFKKEKRKPGKGEKYMYVSGKKVIAPIMT
tara:strand:- start:6 stop:530 length:525 start_codon:yes stop_codon:yes gene_type:complete